MKICWVDFVHFPHWNVTVDNLHACGVHCILNHGEALDEKAFEEF